MMNKKWENSIKDLWEKRIKMLCRFEIAPYRDWRIIMSIFFIGMVVSVAFSVYLFMGVRGDTLFSGGVKKDDSVKMDVTKLTKTINMFQARSKQFEELKMATTTLVDPSL